MMLVTELIWGLTRYFALLMTDLMPKVFPRTSDPTNSRTIRVPFGFLALDIRVPPEVWCFRYVFGVQIPSQEMFGCLGWNFGGFSDEKIHASSCNFLWVLVDLGMEKKTCIFFVDLFFWGIAMDCLTPFLRK